MVFVILTRPAFDEIEPRVLIGRDALWVNAGVLSDSEVARLRASGWDLTTWTHRLDFSDSASEIDRVRLHHPGQVIWAEARLGQQQP
jgi:hypothetical protein